MPQQRRTATCFALTPCKLTLLNFAPLHGKLLDSHIYNSFRYLAALFVPAIYTDSLWYFTISFCYLFCLIMCVIFLVFLALGVALYLRRRSRQSSTRLTILITDVSGRCLKRVTCVTPLEKLADLSPFLRAKCASPLLFCRRCGYHTVNELCYAPTVMDPASLDIMVRLLDRTLTDSGNQHFRHRVSHVLDVAEYLLLPEPYLQTMIPDYFLSDPLGTCHEPQFILSIRDLYSAGYTSLARQLYLLWPSQDQRASNLALCIFPDVFEGTDFFWGD